MTLKRSGFKRPERIKPVRPPITPSPEAGRAKMSVVGFAGSVPKENVVRSEPYRRAVASLACYRCRLEGFSQACHGDENKSMSRKTCDLTCWPGCGARPDGSMGCHEYVSRVMSREHRREFEKLAAADTQAALILKSQEPGKEAARLRTILRDIGLVR